MMKDAHTHNLEAGADALINLPLDMSGPSAQSMRSLMRPGWSYSIGIHPWDTNGDVSKAWEAVEQLASDPQIVAIGETGLDAMRGAPLDIQEKIFLQHVQLSERIGKPLIIHAVKTLNRIVELRKSLRPTQRWMVHGFRGKPEQARQLIAAGFDISLGKNFNPAVVAVIPAFRLHFESD